MAKSKNKKKPRKSSFKPPVPQKMGGFSGYGIGSKIGFSAGQFRIQHKG